jgi:TetR/AcrR family transcriptional repressor of nem operon
VTLACALPTAGLRAPRYGALRPRAGRGTRQEVADLATTLVAALQGGLLLAQATRSTRPLELALDAALERIELKLRE